ncbi:MAG: NUDIX hydrolase [Thermoproteota archaeon]
MRDIEKGKILDSKTIYRGELLNLRIDTFRLHAKKVIREIVEHPGAVAVLPLLRSNVILLVKQYREAAGEVLLEIPAGTLRSGEGAKECAERELAEETGYVCGEIRKMFSCYLAPGYSSELINIFLAKKLVAGRASPEPDEEIRVVPVTFGEAKRMIRQENIRDAKTIAAILWFLNFES